MSTNSPSHNTVSFIVIAALAACAALAGPAQAGNREVTVRLAVSTAGLDLRQPAGARELYGRIQIAARVVCGSGNRVGLEPVTDFGSCTEQALGDAIRSVNISQLTMVYLRMHTLQDASTRGIHVPAQVAAK